MNITIETVLVAITLLVTVYFSYRSNKTQQQALTIKSAEEFGEKDLKKLAELEEEFGASIFYHEGEEGEITEGLIRLVDHTTQRMKLMAYLNHHESLARGINLKVYDEAIFKSARQTSYVETFEKFRDFIYYYREQYNRPRAWIEFERLATRWAKK